MKSCEEATEYMVLQFYGCLLLAFQLIVIYLIGSNMPFFLLLAVILGLIIIDLLSIKLILRGYRGYKKYYKNIPLRFRIIDIISKVIFFIVTTAFLGWISHLFLPFD